MTHNSFTEKDHLAWVVWAQTKEPSGSGFALGCAAGLGFGFAARFLPLQIGIPSFPLLSFVVLLAHNSLHSERIPIVCGTMIISEQRFNIYLLVALAAAMAGGCQSTPERQAKKALSTLRLHLESGSDRTKSTESVPVYREKPVYVTVQKEPFLSEANVTAASVVDEEGGYALRIQFDDDGQVLLEECTTRNRGRRIAIFSQFAPELKDYRWLAAPLITHRISDGVLVFTPDATREEAQEIAVGLNNVAKKSHTWIDKP
jgi:SecDF, P1 head subdomain